MRFIPPNLYDWIERMETTCRRSFEVEYLRIFEMENRVRIVIDSDLYKAYTRQKRMGNSG
jgi:hypothetical protein